jgi:DNA invertase Pin-like site-specific DNA recombinase
VSGLGLEDQAVTMTKWCFSNNLPIVANLVDEGISGSSTTKREALAVALEILSSGKASALVVKNTSRLGRKTTDVLSIADLALAQGWALVITDLGLDTSTITGRLTLSLLAAVAEHEAGQISERTKSALAAAKARGTVLGRPTTVTSEAVRRVIALRTAGGTWRAIAEQLAAEGIPTGQGGQWHAATARNIYNRTQTP